MWWEDTGHRSSAERRLECSGGSPRQWTGYCIDIGEEEEMLETVDPTWQTTCWLELAVQGISDEEVPWYEYITPLMTGAEGTALSLAKHLLAIWRWSARVQGWDVCLPTPTLLNIGQFMTWDEVQGDVDNSLYSCTLQRVGEAMHSWWWQWPKGKVRDVKVSPLVRAFWEETSLELTASCTRLCWELPLRSVFSRRERGTILHAITFLDDMAVRVPMLNAWDQFIWLLSVAMPWATTEVEQYGYHHRNAVYLSAVMPAMEFMVIDEQGAYLCVVQGLIFEGSILAYNAARDEVEWVPTCRVANDLSWAEERMAVILANLVPCIPQEADCIAELRARHLLGWADDSPLEEDDEQTQEEEDEPEGDEHEEAEEQEQEDPTNLEEQGKMGLGADPWRQSWEWGSIMDDEQPLTFNDLRSDSDTTVGDCFLAHSTPQVPGSPQDAVEVHAWDSEVEAL